MRYKVTFHGPTLTLGQKIWTGVLCGTGSALFIVPSALAPWADVSLLSATAGVAIPAGVAWVFWTAQSATNRRDLRRRDREPLAREGAAMVKLAERSARTGAR